MKVSTSWSAPVTPGRYSDFSVEATASDGTGHVSSPTVSSFTSVRPYDDVIDLLAARRTT